MRSGRRTAGKSSVGGVGLAAGLCLAATFAIVQTTGLSLSSKPADGPEAWMAPANAPAVLSSVKRLVATARTSVALPELTEAHPSNASMAASVPPVFPTVEVARSARLAAGGSAPVIARAGRVHGVERLASAAPASDGRRGRPTRPDRLAEARLPHPSARAVHSTLAAALTPAPAPALAPPAKGQADVAPVLTAKARPLALPTHTPAATANAAVAAASRDALAPSSDAPASTGVAVAAAEPLPQPAADVAAPVPAHAAVPIERPEIAAAAPVVLASAAPVAPLDDAPQASAPLPAARPEAAEEVEASNPAAQAGDTVPPADLPAPAALASVPLPALRPERPPTAVARAAPVPAREAAPEPQRPMTTRAPQTELAYAKPDKPTFSWGNIFGRSQSSTLPAVGRGVAVYDIDNATVYMPDGERLEAHSGLGRMVDDPRYVKYRNTGPTPPGRYNLVLRENPFHGVEAVRLLPVDGVNTYGRDGFLAHTYMLRGRKGESNGCVVFKNYQKFLAAFKRGHVTQMVVVPRMSALQDMVASR